MVRPRKRLGTTLVELAVAVVFLAVCTTAILECVTGSQVRTSYLQRRSAALGAAQDKVAKIRSTGARVALTPGTTVESAGSEISVSQTISLVPTYSDLYDVTVQASWADGERLRGAARTDTITLRTYVRAPNN